MPRVEHGNVGSREVLYPTYDSGVFMPAIPEREVRDAEHREINAVREERSGGRPRQISARDEARRVMPPPHANNPNTQSLKFVVVDRRSLSPLGGGHDVRSGRGCAAPIYVTAGSCGTMLRSPPALPQAASARLAGL